MKQKANRRRGGSLGNVSKTNTVDLILQNINAHGHMQVPQICLWIKELYELKDTQPKTCYTLLDKLIRKAPMHHLPHRLRARILQHEVLLLQLPSGGPSASVCQSRMEVLREAYQATMKAVQLNNTSQLSISLLFSMVLQLIVEILVEHHLRQPDKWDIPLGEAGECVQRSIELFAAAAQNIIKQAFGGGAPGPPLDGPYLIVRGGQTSIDPGLQGLWSRHRNAVAFARLPPTEVSCALADESRDLQKLMLMLHELPQPTLLDYHDKLLSTLLDPAVPKWLPASIAGPYYPIMEKMISDSAPTDLWNTRGTQYTTPQYSLLYSEEQAIALMLENCSRPWEATSAADVHGLYCKQLGQLGSPFAQEMYEDPYTADPYCFATGVLQGTCGVPGSATPFNLAQCLVRGYSALGPGGSRRGPMGALVWGASEAAKWEHVVSFWSQQTPKKQLDLLCVPLTVLMQRLPSLRRQQCICKGDQTCAQCTNLGGAMEAIFHQMACVESWEPNGVHRGAFSGSPTHLLCCPCCPGPAMLAPAFLAHLAQFHLAPLMRQGNTVCCSLCSSKVYGTHFYNPENNLHCLACTFCLLDGRTDKLPDGWRRACSGELPLQLLDIDQVLTKKNGEDNEADTPSDADLASGSEKTEQVTIGKDLTATVKISAQGPPPAGPTGPLAGPLGALKGPIVEITQGGPPGNGESKEASGATWTLSITLTTKTTTGGLGSLLEQLPKHVHGTAGMLSSGVKAIEGAEGEETSEEHVEVPNRAAPAIKEVEKDKLLQDEAADAVREKLCLPVFCSPEADLLVKPGLLESLFEACKLDGRLDTDMLAVLRLRPCNWWLKMVDQHAANAKRAKRVEPTRGGPVKAPLSEAGGPSGSRSTVKTVPINLPGALQWVLGAVEPFEEACFNLFRDRLMVDLEARRQGDQALRDTPRKTPTQLTCPALCHLSPQADMPFAGIERISILARHLQQRQEAMRVNNKLKAAMRNMQDAAKLFDAALIDNLSSDSTATVNITDRMQRLLAAVQANNTLLQLDEAKKLVDLAHRYTLTKIGLRDAIVLFEGYLTTALHEVMANILRTEEWQTNVTFALIKKARNGVEQDTYKETYQVKLDDLATAREQLVAVEGRRSRAHEKAVEVRRITDTFCTIMESYDARNRSANNNTSLGAYMEHLNLLLRANTQDMLLQSIMEEDCKLALQALEQHMGEHDSVQEALVRVTLLANTSPALTVITSEIRQIVENRLFSEARAACDKAYEELLEKEEQHKAAEKAKAEKRAAKKRAAKEAAAAAAAAAASVAAEEAALIASQAAQHAALAAAAEAESSGESGDSEAFDGPEDVFETAAARDEKSKKDAAAVKNGSEAENGTGKENAAKRDAAKTEGSAKGRETAAEGPRGPAKGPKGSPADRASHSASSKAKEEAKIAETGSKGKGKSTAATKAGTKAATQAATQASSSKSGSGASGSVSSAGSKTLEKGQSAAAATKEGAKEVMKPLMPPRPAQPAAEAAPLSPQRPPQVKKPPSPPTVPLPPQGAPQGPRPMLPPARPGVIRLPPQPARTLGQIIRPPSPLKQPNMGPPQGVPQRPPQGPPATFATMPQQHGARDPQPPPQGPPQGPRGPLLEPSAFPPLPSSFNVAVQNSAQDKTAHKEGGSSLFSVQPGAGSGSFSAGKSSDKGLFADTKEWGAGSLFGTGGMQQFSMSSPLQESLQQALELTRQQAQDVAAGSLSGSQGPRGAPGSWTESQTGGWSGSGQGLLQGSAHVASWSSGSGLLSKTPTAGAPSRGLLLEPGSSGAPDRAPQTYSLFGGDSTWSSNPSASLQSGVNGNGNSQSQFDALTHGLSSLAGLQASAGLQGPGFSQLTGSQLSPALGTQIATSQMPSSHSNSLSSNTQLPSSMPSSLASSLIQLPPWLSKTIDGDDTGLWVALLHSLASLARLPHLVLHELPLQSVQNSVPGQVALLTCSGLQHYASLDQRPGQDFSLPWSICQQLATLMRKVYSQQAESVSVPLSGCEAGSALQSLLRVLDTAFTLLLIQQHANIDTSPAAPAGTPGQVLRALPGAPQGALTGPQGMRLKSQVGAPLKGTPGPCRACGAPHGLVNAALPGDQRLYVHRLELGDLVRAPLGAPLQSFIRTMDDLSTACPQFGTHTSPSDFALETIPVLLPVALCWQNVPPTIDQTALQQRVAKDAPMQLLLGEVMPGILGPSISPSTAYTLRSMLCWHSMAGYVSITWNAATDSWTAMVQDGGSTLLPGRGGAAEACCDTGLQLLVLLYEAA